MRKRAQQVDETRQRIVEAAAELHTTVGPANTTVSALAAAAGVTRLTVYRHFPDEDQLFAACRRHWILGHPSPDPDVWRAIPSLEERTRTALTALYAWYEAHAEALHPIYRDFTAMPESVQQSMLADDAHMVDALTGGSAAHGSAQPRLRAAAGHVIDYRTWRSLRIDQGLDQRDAVCLAVRLVTAASADCSDAAE